ncbi:hypothetical protein JB92DRAFT_56507 [Gautieria morchelliformis]|nr:hypothetical protein JB92DRAFT_56507 [Gautieria morchelliformis]
MFNSETKKTHRVATAEMADLNGYVDQRVKAGTTSSEIAQTTRVHAEEAKRDLKAIDEELKKNKWRKATIEVGTVESVREDIAKAKREFKERSDEEMRRKYIFLVRY